jgi:NADPH:quinone reductase-like Zn-dependent oxidoreductase
MMRAYQIVDEWQMENVRQVVLPQPAPQRGQLLLKMRAASLNYRDLIVPLRGYGSKTGVLPLIPVSDGVGEVVAVGEGVSNFAIGARVCPLFMPRWQGGEPDGERLNATLGGPLDGVMAEYVVADQSGVAAVPAHLSDVQAATLPVAGLTAWSAVMTYGGVKPGDRVLVQGTGGVSLFALQFAVAAGCRVCVLSSSDEKLERVRAMGAEHTINYVAQAEWGAEVKAWAGGDGVDLVVEVGGEKTLPQSLRAVRIGGTISLIGVLSGGRFDVALGPIVTRHVRLQGITVGHADGFRAMTAAIAAANIEPVVGRVFAFDQLHPALDYLGSGQHFGKVCLGFE